MHLRVVRLPAMCEGSTRSTTDGDVAYVLESSGTRGVIAASLVIEPLESIHGEILREPTPADLLSDRYRSGNVNLHLAMGIVSRGEWPLPFCNAAFAF